MKSVDEIKKNAREKHFTEVYGISKDEFSAINAEIMQIMKKMFSEDKTATEAAIRVLEEVLILENYSSEQLLRMAIFMRNLARHRELLIRNMIGMALVNPETGFRYLSTLASYEVICPFTGEKIPKVVCMDCPQRHLCPAQRGENR